MDFGTAGGAGGNTFKLYVADNAGNLSSATSNLVTVKSAYGFSGLVRTKLFGTRGNAEV